MRECYRQIAKVIGRAIESFAGRSQTLASPTLQTALQTKVLFLTLAALKSTDHDKQRE